MNLHVFQHIAMEGPGSVADWARDRGYAVSTTHFYRGDAAPSAPAEVDFLLIMGGPMNIYQDPDHPWLRAERAWIREYLKLGRPAVGICLGSQLLADALGGRVTQNPQVEIGWFPVAFSVEARGRFPFLPEASEVLHWHGDTFELPENALRIGSSEACVNQGFLYDNRVLGLQFHLEMTPESVRELAEADAASLIPSPTVQSAETMLGHAQAAYEAEHDLLRKLLDGLVE